LDVRVLGPIEVAGGARPLPRGRQRTILALLALRANEVVSTERLVTAAWSDAGRRGVDNLLQVYVSRIRGVLGRDRLSRVDDGYVLHLAPSELDALRFGQLCEQGRRALAGGDAATARRLLDQALGLWRGDEVAGGVIDDVLEPAVAQLREERVLALEDRLDADLRLGAHAQVIAELETFVRENPFRERPRGQLMLALYRAGRQAEALEEYRSARAAFVESIGVEPGPALRGLERAILEQDPSLNPPLDVSSPPAVVAPPTSLVGRAADLARLTALLRRPDVRLVTLTGVGGIGKTRLALAAVDAIRTDFAEGVQVVSLASVTDPAHVLAAIGAALRIGGGGTNADAVLEARLRDAELLLLLDNVEHVVEAAADIQRLLHAAPRLKILATSTALLRLSGEREFVVPLLELPAERAAPESVVTAPAVALYADRAGAVAPDFVLDVETAPVVAAICRRLEGHPLAIELAAARTRLLPPAAQLERLEHGFELLAGGMRDAPERHRTLRAALEWTYELLDPSEQLLCAQLAVFVGGWTLESAEAVCTGGDDVLDGLVSLREKSMVTRTGIEPRFLMLEPVRRFALEKLEARPEAADVRRRHALHFAGVAERVEPALMQGGHGGEFELLEQEHANCRVALRSSLDSGDAETALRLAAALARFWFVHGYIGEGRQWLHEALALPASVSPALRARALHREGVLAFRQRDEGAARELLEHSLALCREMGDDDGAALALNLLGYWHEESFHEAAALYQRIGNARGLAIARMNLGGTRLAQGDYASAAELATEAIELSRTAGDEANRSIALLNLAYALLELGRADEGRPMVQEAVELARSLHFKEQVVYGLEALATFALARGRPGPCARVLGAAETLRQSIGIQLGRYEFASHERTAEAAQSTLGENAFAVEWEKGARLDVDDAVAFGLACLVDEPEGRGAREAGAEVGFDPLRRRVGLEHVVASSAEDGRFLSDERRDELARAPDRPSA
jgi:predicted ATPase/DNA-binding SARP family transcriptional activator